MVVAVRHVAPDLPVGDGGTAKDIAEDLPVLALLFRTVQPADDYRRRTVAAGKGVTRFIAFPEKGDARQRRRS